MSPKSELRRMIKRHEGLCLKPYMDSTGNLTIGYGRNLTNGISEREAEIMLDHDIAQAQQDLYEVEPEALHLSTWRYYALVDMMFNLGRKRFSSFKKMLKAIREGDHLKVAQEMLDSKWAEQVKGRSVELALIMREGKP